MGEMSDRIMKFVYNGLTYSEMISELKRDGISVSKGYIKRVIKDTNPKLFNIITNSKRLQQYARSTFKTV